MTISLDKLAPLAWTQFWQVSLVAIVAGGVARFLCQDRPRLAYALWMLVVVKALAPPIWSSPTGVFSWALAVQEMHPSIAAEFQSAPILVSNTPAISVPIQTTPAFSPTEPIPAQVVLLFVWGFGLVAFLFLAISKQAVCSFLIRQSNIPVCEDLIAKLDDLRRRLGIRRRVRLIVSTRPIGPAAFGLLRPTIVLPDILLAGKTSEQVELILAHELVHIQRGDILAGYSQLAAQVVWWFHPLIWWTNREATRERERCCDRDVVEGVGCRPSAYARTLLSVVELKSRLRIPAAIPGVRAMEVTSQRLETIMRFPSGRGKGTWLPRIAFACGAILLVPGAGLTLQAEADEKPRRRIVTEMTLETKATEEIKKAEDELRWAEGMYEKKYINKARLAEARWKLLKLKLSPKDFSALRRDLDLAKADVTRSEDRVDWAGKMREKGYISEAQLNKEQLALQKAKDQLKAINAKLEELQQPAPRKPASRITLKGVARERGTGRPIAGASITAQGKEPNVITDKDGRFEFGDLPEAEEYSLVGSPKSGESFLITSARVKPAKGETTINLDLEYARGIPYRVRVVDKDTGKPLLDPATSKPLQGHISYFPIRPTDPYKRGAWGYSQMQENGMVAGAFHEAYNVDENGQYRGAVLPGPGVLCFSSPAVVKRKVVTDHEPSFFYPDGKDAVRIASYQNPKCSIIDLPIRGSKSSLGIVLNQYTSVIAINPKEDAKEVSYEIKLDQAEASK